MQEVEFICLANSRKRGGSCVAGVRVDGGGWVRPISAAENGALQPAQTALCGGGVPQVLDHVSVVLLFPLAAPHQPENWVASVKPWRLVSRPARDMAIPLLRSRLRKGPGLFGGTADRIKHDSLVIAPAAASLALVSPQFFEWNIVVHEGKRRNRAAFVLDGQAYDLGLTDPVWEERLAALPPGRHPKEAAGLARDDKLLLTVSLGEPFKDGCCYKLVAAVIPVPKHWRDKF